MNRKTKKIATISLGTGILLLLSIAAFSSFKSTKKNESLTLNENAVVVSQMNKSMYLEKIYDYEKSPNSFKYKGTKPAVIDFYADWCRPCKKVAPIMDELAKQYEGKVTFYKVNVDLEQELAAIHQVQSIPMIMILSPKEEPKVVLGALNKEEYVTLIEETINKKK